MHKRMNFHDPLAVRVRQSPMTGDRVTLEADGTVYELDKFTVGRTESGFYVDTDWVTVAEADEFRAMGESIRELSRPAEAVEHEATQEAATDDNTGDEEQPDDASEPETRPGRGRGRGWSARG